MGNRLSKIVTRTGDDGSTGLCGQTRISKNSARIEAIGCVDELNSWLGLLYETIKDTQIIAHLKVIQHRLFDIGGMLAMPDENIVLNTEAVSHLESWLGVMNESLPDLKEFILPGGTLNAAHCQVARSVCRRCERRIVALSESESINADIQVYINRLSDCLFVLARYLVLQAGEKEHLWDNQLQAPRM